MNTIIQSVNYQDIVLIIVGVLILLSLFSPWLIAMQSKATANKKSYNKNIDEEYFNVKYTPKVEIIFSKLKDANQEHIIIKDDFIVNKEYYDLILPGKYVTDYIDRLAVEIFSYIELIPIDVTVVYEWEDRYATDKKEAGYYRRKGFGYSISRDIQVKVNKDYNCKDIAAILCHEITHYYMDVRNIHFSDNDENEEATDITAVILGFGQILIDGYIKHSRIQNYGNYTTNQAATIGYISSDDCRIILRIVNSVKRKANEENNYRQNLESNKKNIEKKIEVAQYLNEKLQQAVKNWNIESASVENVSTVQEMYSKIECGYFLSQISKMNNMKSKATTVEEIKIISDKIDKLCTEIAMFNSIIGKS